MKIKSGRFFIEVGGELFADDLLFIGKDYGDNMENCLCISKEDFIALARTALPLLSGEPDQEEPCHQPSSTF